MKMVFFSSESLEVEQVGRELVHAGIPCEILAGPVPEGLFPSVSYSELWIQNDQDYQRALLVCVALGLGFAKRVTRAQPVKAGDID